MEGEGPWEAKVQEDVPAVTPPPGHASQMVKDDGYAARLREREMGN